MKKLNRKIVVLFIVLVLALGAAILMKLFVFQNPSSQYDEKIFNSDDTDSIEKNLANTRLTLIIDGVRFNVELEDNASVHELLSLLPFEVNMTDLNQNEKYVYFNGTFSTDLFSPSKIERGDIMLYGNDCLVIFYESFDTSYLYTKIGKITNTDNLKSVLGNDSVKVKFALTDD